MNYCFKIVLFKKIKIQNCLKKDVSKKALDCKFSLDCETRPQLAPVIVAPGKYTSWGVIITL